MKEKEIRSLLHHADADIAMQIADRWPYPDKRTHTAGSNTEHGAAESVSEVAVAVQHPPVWRYAATFAAVLLLIGGSVGGIMLMQSMHRSELVPSAEEQSLASSGSEPDTKPLPIIVPGLDEEPVESAEPESPESAWEAESLSLEKSLPDTDAAVSSAVDTSAANLVAETAAPTDAVKETSSPAEAATEAPKPGRRITLAEAIRICSESADVYEAAQAIEAQYVADYCSGTADMRYFYLDEKGNESVWIGSSDSGEPYTGIYYTNRDGERWVLASTQRERPTTACLYLTQKQTEESIRWEMDELSKTDSALTEEQKSQLRALEQEEADLWTITYIRRRVEIGGMLSRDAPRLTCAMTEHLCAACKTPEQAIGIILNSYVPDFEWGSGMTYYNYKLNADTNEVISLVVGSGIYYWENFDEPKNRRDFFQ